MASHTIVRGHLFRGRPCGPDSKGDPRRAAAGSGSQKAPHAGPSRRNRTAFVLGVLSSAVGIAAIAVVKGSVALVVIGLITMCIGAAAIGGQGYLLCTDRRGSSVAMITGARAFVFRIACAVSFASILNARYGMPFVDFNDDYVYDTSARMSSDVGLEYLWSQRQPGYLILLAMLNQVAGWLDGYQYLIPRVVNAGVGAVLAAGIVQTAMVWCPNDGRIRLLGALCVAFPDYLYYSSLTLRDILISYLWMLGLIAVIAKRSVVARASVLGCAAVLLFPLRVGIATLLVMLGALALVPTARRIAVRGKVMIAGIALLVIGLGFVLPNMQGTKGPSDGEIMGTVSAEMSTGIAVATRSKVLAERKAVSGLQTVFERLPLAVRPLFFSVFQFYSPVPFWRIGGDNEVFEWLFVVNGLLWMVVTCAATVVIARTCQGRWVAWNMAATLLFAAIPVIASGATYGTIRYRLPAIGPIFVVVFAGFNEAQDKKWVTLLVISVVAASAIWEVLRASLLGG